MTADAESQAVGAAGAAVLRSSSAEPTESTPFFTLPKDRSLGYWLTYLVGPGLFVCLADTDGASMVVAAQSGIRWGYCLLPLQLMLIPVLYLAQELTVRLGVHTQQGLTANIKQHFGCSAAWVACVMLVVECAFAMVSEMKGISSVAELWGFTSAQGVILAAGIIVLVILLFPYRKVEVIGVTLGSFELVFVVTMFMYHPSPLEVLKGSFTFHASGSYMRLVAANIGAVIMPWMLFFQQSAIVARKLRTEEDEVEERLHTMIGSIVSQIVMIGILVTLAAAGRRGDDLESVVDVVNALGPAIGLTTAKVVVSLGFFGGSMCAAFVVALAASWSVCEAAGWDGYNSLGVSPTTAPHFYACFLGLVTAGLVFLVVGNTDIVKLSIAVEMVGAVLLPFTVACLYVLATGDFLPAKARVTGNHKRALAVIFPAICLVSIGTSLFGFGNEVQDLVTISTSAVTK